MRVTSAFSRLLDLSGVWVRKVRFEPDRVVVTVVLRGRLLHCPKCSYSTRYRESKQHHDSVWRHLDLGRWRLEVHARLRRVRCPEHGVHVEGVPFARDGARFTRDFGGSGHRCGHGESRIARLSGLFPAEEVPGSWALVGDAPAALTGMLLAVKVNGLQGETACASRRHFPGFCASATGCW